MAELRHSIKITPADVEYPDDGTASIWSPELLDALIQKQQSVLKWLSDKFTEVSLDSISLDSDARVIVSDSNFAHSIRQRMDVVANTEGITNGGCNFGCTS
jgi:hypothetical protein